jgi:hypothetical protein
MSIRFDSQRVEAWRAAGVALPGTLSFAGATPPSRILSATSTNACIFTQRANQKTRASPSAA